ncbi:uncharacterized protein, partial [Littorina saxatilis]|uniref:uncharacterized protein n=1 Tax=Littorina saxatilis TaxID=31220 RepID=UPI0038B4EEDF
QASSGTASDQGRCEEPQFMKRLKTFPNLFFQDCAQRASQKRLTATLLAITDQQSRREADDLADLQGDCYSQNIATLLHWKLGDSQKAEASAVKAVEDEGSSLLALSNWAFILWQRGETTRAKQQLLTLETLRGGDRYEDLEIAAEVEVVYLFVQLRYLFKPFVISKRQEQLLQRRPDNAHFKYYLALTLKRYTYPFYMARHPQVDFIPAIPRAIKLLVEIKDQEDLNENLRGKAAAVLGEILSCQGDTVLMAVVEEERRRLGLETSQCFEDALRLADSNPEVLVKAGKYFQKDLPRSKELLEKAVSIRPEPKAHRQLGVTLKKLALQAKKSSSQSSRSSEASPNRQGNWRQPSSSGSRGGGRGGGWGSNQGNWRNGGENRRNVSPSATGGPSLSMDDRDVKEAMHHFHKALELSDGENFTVLKELALLHIDLGEYDEALSRSIEILPLSPFNVLNISQATEYASQAWKKMAETEENSSTRRNLQELSDFCLSLTLINRCYFLMQTKDTTRLNADFWFSLHSLCTTVKLNNVQSLKSKTFRVEGDLLVIMKNNMDSLPVLRDLSHLTESQAKNVGKLKEMVKRYVKDLRYADALIFLSLLNLTQQSPLQVVADLDLRAHLLLAQDRLTKCVGENPKGAKINIFAAKLLFDRAFDNVFSPRVASATDDLAVDLAGDNAEQEGDLPLSPLLLSPPSENIPYDPSSSDLDDDVSQTVKILLLHDHHDEEAEQDVTTLRDILQEICGLMTSVVTDKALLSSEGAPLMLVVVGNKGISPEFSALIDQASGPRPSHLLSLTLNSATLPDALRGHQYFPCSSRLLGQGQQGSRSEDGARAVYELFCDTKVFSLSSQPSCSIHFVKRDNTSASKFLTPGIGTTVNEYSWRDRAHRNSRPLAVLDCRKYVNGL